MTRLARLALDHSRVVIGIFVILTLLLGVSARLITTDNATESLYPDESTIDALNSELQATFQQHDRLLLVVEGDIYSSAGLAGIRDLTASLRRLPGVVDVTSVATAKRMED